MKSRFKMLGGSGLILAAALGYNQAAVAAACPADQTLDAFIALGGTGCDIGPLQFSYLGDTIANNGNVAIQITETIAGVYQLSTDFQQALSLADTGETLDYQVALLDSLVFRSVSIDSDVPAATPGVTVTKTIDPEGGTIGTGAQATVVSTNGGPGGPAALCDDCDTILVRDLYEITSTGALNGITNTFDLRPPTQVPAPAPIALLGFGIAAMGMMRRRKKVA